MKPSKIIPFEKCFASSSKAIYWSDKNTLKITDVYISSIQERLEMLSILTKTNE